MVLSSGKITGTAGPQVQSGEEALKRVKDIWNLTRSAEILEILKKFYSLDSSTVQTFTIQIAPC